MKEETKLDHISVSALTMMLKPDARLSPKQPINTVVKKEGPAPRAALMIRLAAVNAVPLHSGALTLMIQGLTFTEGMLAKHPPAKA